MVASELRASGSIGFGVYRDAPERLIGYALFRLLPPTAELNRIAVSSSQRRQGLAAALLGHAHGELAQSEATECLLEVRESNGAAIALYEQHGYQHVGRRRGYYSDGSDALVLRAQLA